MIHTYAKMCVNARIPCCPCQVFILSAIDQNMTREKRPSTFKVQTKCYYSMAYNPKSPLTIKTKELHGAAVLCVHTNWIKSIFCKKLYSKMNTTWFRRIIFVKPEISI